MSFQLFTVLFFFQKVSSFLSKPMRFGHASELTSSRTTTAFSAGAGRGTEREGPGSETLDNLLFLTPVQLFGILKAQRLW